MTYRWHLNFFPQVEQQQGIKQQEDILSEVLLDIWCFVYLTHSLCHICFVFYLCSLLNNLCVCVCVCVCVCECVSV